MCVLWRDIFWSCPWQARRREEHRRQCAWQMCRGFLLMTERGSEKRERVRAKDGMVSMCVRERAMEKGMGGTKVREREKERLSTLTN